MKHCALTASNWSKAVGFVALNAALLFNTGCASTGKVEPISQRLPQGSSCVALVSLSAERKLAAGVPSMADGPMAEGARVFGLDPAGSILKGMDPRGAVASLAVAVAWIPPGVLGGLIHGAVTGIPDIEIQSAIQTADKFVNHFDFEAGLIREVTDMSWTDHQIGLNSFSTHSSEQAFAALSQRGFRHVIEMEMGPVSLDGDYELRNPRLSLKVDVTAKLYRLHGSRQEEVHLIQVRYRGDKQRFVRWMAEDAKALRAEVNKCQRTVAAQILEAFAE
ncbi:MAG: hypothetical protein B9S33_21960 [Pedosphaera sp. Tous-C6FEB]|nr:MAG: hypothetical protein B9S33_21960 [Pedosphaera sp. Tous-C6FEB]